MGPAPVHIGVVDVGRLALAGLGVVHAHGGLAILHRYAVGTRVGPEIGVEGPVLLLDDDHVLDLVNTGRHDVAAGPPATHPLLLGRCRRRSPTA